MNTLYVIPARGGSKGIPRKNIRKLNGKPLIHYSIEAALALAPKDNICVTTDDPEIAAISEQKGIKVPFIRPAEFASDTSSMQEVLRHAIGFYEKNDKFYDALVLLQPTTPFRDPEDIRNALSLYRPEIDMVMSVYETKANPYYVLFEEVSGFLVKSKQGDFDTRQSAPSIYQANGSIYVINVSSLMTKSMKDFHKVKKLVLDEIKSVDIDTLMDWEYCEFLISKGYHK